MKQFKVWAIGAGLAALMVAQPSQVEARNFRIGQIPNSAFGCQICHVGANGGSRNAFGADVEFNLSQPGPSGDAQWALVFALDSDGDGFSNGEELGDPEGAWLLGSPDPPGGATNPGDPDDFPIDPEACGNGLIDRGEQCDGDDLGDRSCAAEGFDGGTLVCDGRCRLDTSACAECGDDRLDPGEQCDGEALGGASCQSEGFDGGRLLCGGRCEIDTSGCTVCGNGAREASERCDGDDLGGEDCASRGYLGGALACSAGCDFDEGGCVEDPGNVCGDGARRNGEQCDGDDLGAQSCEALGFVGGALACDAGCVLDVSGCQACGNGRIDAGEQCDGENFGGLGCGDLGLGEGALACDAGCVRDTSGCAPGAVPDEDEEEEEEEEEDDDRPTGAVDGPEPGCAQAPGAPAGGAWLLAMAALALLARRSRRGRPLDAPGRRDQAEAKSRPARMTAMIEGSVRR